MPKHNALIIPVGINHLFTIILHYNPFKGGDVFVN